MRPSKSAGRLSCLVMNPDNEAASARRREQLLTAFLALDEDAQADLLEAIESMVFSHTPAGGHDRDLRDARQVMDQLYSIAGWRESYSG